MAEFVDLIELECNYCALSYGVSPCTASGAAGSECHQTFKTCQDKANYSQISRWHRLISSTRARLPALVSEFGAGGTVSLVDSLGAFLVDSTGSVLVASASEFAAGSTTHAAAMIDKRVVVNPIRIDPGKSLGQRGQITVMMQDIPWHDLDMDPYVSTRPYAPGNQGTYWGKFRARHYYESRQIKHYVLPVVDGQRLTTVGVTPSIYVASVLEGPDRNGAVKLVGKDPLKLLDDDKAKLGPPLDVRLAVAMSDTTSSVPATVVGEDISLLEASAYYRIDDEILLGSWNGTTLTLTRAQRGTVVAEHDADATVYPCTRLQGTLDQVLVDIIEGVGVPSSYIPSADWATEIAAWRVATVDVLITEPTGAQSLVNELCEQYMLQVWPDLEAGQFQLRALRPQEPLTEWTEDGNVLRGTFSQRDLRDSRVSDVIIYFGQRNPNEKLNEGKNYASVIKVSDADASSASEYGTARTKVVYSRWFRRTDRAFVVTMAYALLSEYRDTPSEYTIELQESDTIGLANAARLAYWTMQDATGAGVTKDVQVIEEAQLEPGGRHRVVLREYRLGGRFMLWAADGTPSYASATDAEKVANGFWSADDGTVDGDEAHKYYPG